MPARSCLQDNQAVFMNRRKGEDRRLEQDRCRDMSVDLYHRKRRKTVDRRASNRTLVDDVNAFYDL
ncbi:hypothetical protein [Sessilibacter corallicola]|uniref:Uncharacterized protein n=1 Tax=Sessilibacter corallicola TaxID=2904075 RepID=A0ABQ0A771_9GAMM|nr:hypothetical protein [Sessilibacter corallicola]MCE2028455.1 hypothetical protein [Sessilibacter corallicola]